MPKFSPYSLKIDPVAEIERISATLNHQVTKTLRRRGIVVGLSGGIDSSVVAALAAKAMGNKNVLGLFMPEGESDEDTNKFGRMIADSLGIETVMENITPILTAAGCYKRRNDAIRELVPEFTDDYKCKITLPSIVDDDRLRIFSLVVQSPAGEIKTVRVKAKSYLTIVAASNFKQRTRKMIEYYHADKNNFVVAGTPNRLEYDQGFFVKNGDGAADVKPIAHLYKTQVYELAKHLGVPSEIINRPPTTDTYSMPQTQEEFYFSLPYDKMDICLCAVNMGCTPDETADAVGLTPEQTERVFRDIDAKRRSSRYSHLPPLIIDDKQPS